MIERMVIAVAVMGIGGFLVYHGALRAGWTVPEARNLLLLTMVLFEIVHIGNCRSETRSAFALSPLRNPMLFFGSLAAFGLHVLAMSLPLLQNVLYASPVSPSTWLVAFGISLSVLPAVEIHKWYLGRRPPLEISPAWSRTD